MQALPDESREISPLIRLGVNLRRAVFPGDEASALMLRAGCSLFTLFPTVIYKFGKEARGNVSMIVV
jgi:hypothetical protein